MQRVLDGSAAQKRDLAVYCESKAVECRETANAIELGQFTWIVMGLALVVELLASLAMPVGGMAAAAGVRMAARKGWQLAWVQLIESVMALCARLSASRAALIGQGIVVGGVLGGGVTWSGQMWQQHRGDRDRIDWETVTVSGAGGAAGGLGAGVLYTRPVAGALARLQAAGTRGANAGAMLLAGGAAGVAGGVTGMLGGAVAASAYSGDPAMPDGSEFYLGAVSGALEGLLSGGVHTIGHSANPPPPSAGLLGRPARPPKPSDLAEIFTRDINARASGPSGRADLPGTTATGSADSSSRPGDRPPAAPASSVKPVAESIVGAAGTATDPDPAAARTEHLPPSDRSAPVPSSDLTTPGVTAEAGTTAVPASNGPATIPPATVLDSAAHTTGNAATTNIPAGADLAVTAADTDRVIVPAPPDPPVETSATPFSSGAHNRPEPQPNNPWTRTTEHSTPPRFPTPEHTPSPWQSRAEWIAADAIADDLPASNDGTPTPMVARKGAVDTAISQLAAQHGSTRIDGSGQAVGQPAERRSAAVRFLRPEEPGAVGTEPVAGPEQSMVGPDDSNARRPGDAPAEPASPAGERDDGDPFLGQEPRRVQGMRDIDEPPVARREGEAGAPMPGESPAADERGWRQRRVQDESELARVLYHRPETRQAVIAVIDRLRTVLSGLHPQATREQIDNAFYTPEDTISGGMVLRSVPLDELRRDGNLRELMSAVQNAMWRSREIPHPSGTTLDDGLERILNQPDWAEQAERLGLNVDALDRLRETITGGDPDVPIVAEELHRGRNAMSDPRHIPIREEITRSGAVRMLREAPDQVRLNLTVQDWSLLSMPLSVRELEAVPGGLVALRKTRLDPHRPLPRDNRGRVDVKALETQLAAEDRAFRYVLPLYQRDERGHRVRDESGHAVVVGLLAYHEEGPVDAATALRLDPNQFAVPLPWRPGAARFDFEKDSEWFRQTAVERGVPVVSGVSGTAARIASRFIWIMPPDVSKLDFAGAILSLLLPAHHSLYESVGGLELVGMSVVDPAILRAPDRTVAELYEAVSDRFGISAPDGFTGEQITELIDVSESTGSPAANTPDVATEPAPPDPGESRWRLLRLRDEVELARVLYHRPESRQAAVAMLDRLREVLTALHPGATPAEIDNAFYAPENTKAGGMVPRSVSLDELRREGNLRELMAAVYNAMLRSGELAGNPSTTTLDDGVAALLNEENWAEKAQRLGLDVDALDQVRTWVTGDDPQGTIGKSDIRDVRNTVRYPGDRDIADERTLSSADERKRDPREQVRRGLTVQDWALLGMPLSPWELAAIPVAVDQGVPLLAGLSGTAARFAARFLWMRPPGVSETDAAGAILAILSPQHHSLYEQVRGMQMSGLRLVDDAVLRSPDGSAGELHRAVFELFGVPAPEGSARVAPLSAGSIGEKPAEPHGVPAAGGEVRRPGYAGSAANTAADAFRPANLGGTGDSERGPHSRSRAHYATTEPELPPDPRPRGESIELVLDDEGPLRDPDASRALHRSAENSSEAAEEFELRDNQIQSIFDEEVTPALLTDRPRRPLKQVEEPVLYVVGGQPGAGKSTLVDRICDRLSDKGGAALIQADELEKFHPAYSRLYQENDFTAHDYLYPTAQKLRNMLDDFLIPLPYNVLLEGGNTDPRGTLARIRRIGESRSRTLMEVIALPREQSDLARLERFVNGRETDGFGRYTTRQTHDRLYLGSSELVRLVESEMPISVDSLRIRTRADVLYENHRNSDGQWHEPPRGWVTLEDERNREWTREECRTFKDRVASLSELVDSKINQDPARWAPLVDEIDELRVLAEPKLSGPAT